MSDVEQVVTLFARKEKRERLLALASKPSRRADFLDALLHDRRNLDPSALHPVRSDDVSAIVAKVGAPGDEVYVLGGSADGTVAKLADVLALEAGHERDVLLFDRVTRRAYYENHEGESFVLVAR